MSTQPRCLESKVALVTGAAHGIGRAIATRMSNEGAAVAILDREGEVAAQVAASLPNAIAVEADICDERSLDEALHAVVDRHGALDILVNNAGGAMMPARPFWEITRDDWDFLLGVNLTGQWLCSKAAVPHLRARRSGKIVNIASVAGIDGSAGMCAYSSAKGGVIALTKTLAKELGEYAICVNAIAPGYTRFTRPKAVYTAEQLAEIEARRPALQMIKRIGQPEDIAAAAAFLASSDADQITGQVVRVDGGFR